MNQKRLSTLFDSPNRVTILSTADSSGNPNSAIFGSLRLIDEGTLALGMGDNRSLQNLSANPKGILLVFIPGTNVFSWKGIRIYLEVKKIEQAGALLDSMLAEVTEKAGGMATKIIKHVVTFQITSIRPLVDLSAIAKAK